MEAFCSNTLGQTQCNGLTRVAFGAVVSVGLFQGIVALILGGYLISLSQGQKRDTTLAWTLALEGIIYSITVSLEAASRFRPGTLERFILIDNATAGLGIITLVFYFIFHMVYACCLAKQYNGKVVVVIILILAPLAVIALAFNVTALRVISYEELASGIRAGAGDVEEFLNPSIKALAFMLSFMCSTLITQILLHSLLRRRQDRTKKRQQTRLQKSFSSFSTSTIEENNTMELQKPMYHYLQTLIPWTSLAIIKTSLAFAPENTIIARRVIGLVEYTGYFLVVAFCLRAREVTTVGSNNLFGHLSANPSLVSFETQNLRGPYQAPPNPSIMTRANMASFGVGALQPGALDSKNCQRRYPNKSPHTRTKPPIKRNPASTRMSFAAKSAISSLAPEDSASTAAFRPRPPLPPPRLRTRTTHGMNGSELAPLREDLVEQFNRTTEYNDQPAQRDERRR